jgi:hypothetical protein
MSRRGWKEGDNDRRTRKQYEGDKSKYTKLIKEIIKLFPLQ